MPNQKEPATIFDFASYKNRDTVDVLTEALNRAKNGEITGMVFAFYMGNRRHGVGVTGHYRDNPEDAVGVSGQIFKYYSDEDPNVIVKK